MPTDSHVTHTLSPLTNGVSQKPAIERLDSQGEEQLNFFSSASEGLKRRPGAKWLALLTGGVTNDPMFMHVFGTSDGARYVLFIGDSDYRVFSLSDGVEQTYVSPDGVAYLDVGTPITTHPYFAEFAASTSGDTTFITNRNTVPAMTATISPTRPNQLLARVAQAPHQKNYSLLFDTKGTSPAEVIVQYNPLSVESANSIATELKQALWDVIDGVGLGLGTGVGGGTELQSWKTSGIYGLHTEPLDGGTPPIATGRIIWGLQDPVDATNQSDGFDRVIASDQGSAQENLFAWNQKVPNFADLPAIGPEGFIFEITGDDASAFDNYWVVFEEFDNVSSAPVNRWRETVEPGIPIEIDASTMPHTLVKTGASEFTFAEASWADRQVGDEASAPEPSFIGNPIRDLSIHANRLFMVAGESLIGSEVGEYFNFWPTTVSTVVDSDPVDTAGATRQVATWDWIVPYNETVMLFSSEGKLQSRFGKKGEPITPTTTPPTPVSFHACSADVRPVTAGSLIFIMGAPSDTALLPIHGQVSMIQIAVDDGDNVVSTPLTLNVPDYIENAPAFLSVSEKHQLVLMMPNHGNEAYVYKFHQDGLETVQSGWSKWQFGTLKGGFGSGIYGAMIDGDDVIIRADISDLWKLPISPLRSDLAGDASALSPVHLDAFATIASGTYDGGTGLTTWTAPYALRTTHKNNDNYVIVRNKPNGPFGEIPAPLSYPGGDLVTAVGDFSSGEVIFGIHYTSRYAPGEYTMPAGARSGRTAARTAGRLAIRRCAVLVEDSHDFVVETRYTDDDETFTQDFPGLEVPDVPFTFNSLNLQTGRFEFDAGGSSREVRNAIYTEGPFALNIHAIEWNGRYAASATQT